MKTAIITTEEVQQVIFTPENETDKKALSFLTPDAKIELLVKEGQFYSNAENVTPFTASLSEANAGYLGIYHDSTSKILVIHSIDKTK